MKSSYLILDEYMRFLDKGNDEEYVISESILDVGVEKALAQINWDQKAFEDRQGEYDWSRETYESCGSEDKKLEWWILNNIKQNFGLFANKNSKQVF